MFAVIEVGSHQFKVSEGDRVEAFHQDAEAGKDITFDNVLVYANGDDIRIGQPYVKGVTVTAKVQNHHRGEKVIAFKYRRRKDSASKVGHRQDLTTLNITKISAK